jgi:hypothetical protein
MAVENTVAQMALTRDLGPGGFMERVTAVMAYVANATLSESASTAYHSGRALYAQRVLQNPSAAAQAGGPLIVMGVNIVNTTTYDEATKTSTCTATDLEIQSQVQTDWNGLAGLDTPTP